MNTCAIPECTRDVVARGWCRPHYTRWRRHGDPLASVQRRAPDGATPEERLRYVGWTETTHRADLGPCWIWNGLTDRAGYGRVWDGERVVAAHRLAYETWRAPLPPGTHVCHRCDTPACINPSHLFPGDDALNATDRTVKGRTPHGEAHWAVKLTDDDVAAIRAAYTGRRGEQAAIARTYGVAPSLISTIVRGRHRPSRTAYRPGQ